MEVRYNIYFAGQIIDGHQPNAVRVNLGKVFNADQQTLDKLFSGNTQLLKRDCDKATAQRFEQAMAQAGALAIIKAIEGEPPGQTPPTAATSSAAQKIASLAAAPDQGSYDNSPGEDDSTVPPDNTATGNIALAPSGTEVLRENERSVPVTRDVDTSRLEVDATAQRLSEVPAPQPQAPDTSHLDMGAVGDTIPNLPSGRDPLTPNTDDIGLSPEGTDFSDCGAPDVTLPELDLSALDLAPDGSDVLEEKYRKRETPPAPATDHISLED